MLLVSYLVSGMTFSWGGVPLYHIFNLLSYLILGMTFLFLFCSVASVVALCGLPVFLMLVMRNVATIFSLLIMVLLHPGFN